MLQCLQWQLLENSECMYDCLYPDKKCAVITLIADYKMQHDAGSCNHALDTS